MMKNLIAAAAVVVMSAGSASAAAVFAFEETGAGVEGVLSGTLDLTSLTGTGGFFNSTNGSISPSIGQLGSVAFETLTIQTSYSVTGPAAFGSGGLTFADSSDGDAILVEGFVSRLYLPIAFTGGTLAATLLFSGDTFASLGIAPGAYVYTLENEETLTLRFGSEMAPIPLPASLPLLASALIAIGVMRRFRSRANAQVLHRNRSRRSWGEG